MGDVCLFNHEGRPRNTIRGAKSAPEGRPYKDAYFAVYSEAVRFLWPTACGCFTSPLGALASSGHQRWKMMPSVWAAALLSDRGQRGYEKGGGCDRPPPFLWPTR